MNLGAGIPEPLSKKCGEVKGCLGELQAVCGLHHLQLTPQSLHLLIPLEKSCAKGVVTIFIYLLAFKPLYNSILFLWLSMDAFKLIKN